MGVCSSGVTGWARRCLTLWAVFTEALVRNRRFLGNPRGSDSHLSCRPRQTSETRERSCCESRNEKPNNAGKHRFLSGAWKGKKWLTLLKEDVCHLDIARARVCAFWGRTQGKRIVSPASVLQERHHTCSTPLGVG